MPKAASAKVCKYYLSAQGCQTESVSGHPCPFKHQYATAAAPETAGKPSTARPMKVKDDAAPSPLPIVRALLEIHMSFLENTLIDDLRCDVVRSERSCARACVGMYGAVLMRVCARQRSHLVHVIRQLGTVQDPSDPFPEQNARTFLAAKIRAQRPTAAPSEVDDDLRTLQLALLRVLSPAEAAPLRPFVLPPSHPVDTSASVLKAATAQCATSAIIHAEPAPAPAVAAPVPAVPRTNKRMVTLISDGHVAPASRPSSVPPQTAVAGAAVVTTAPPAHSCAQPGLPVPPSAISARLHQFALASVVWAPMARAGFTIDDDDIHPSGKCPTCGVGIGLRNASTSTGSPGRVAGCQRGLLRRC